jgi:hypothetical protein
VPYCKNTQKKDDIGRQGIHIKPFAAFTFDDFKVELKNAIQQQPNGLQKSTQNATKRNGKWRKRSLLKCVTG